MAQTKPEALGVTVITQPRTATASSRGGSAGLAASNDPNSRTQALNVSTPPAQTSSSTTSAAPIPTPAVSQLCDPSQSNLYCVYTVQSGDTLSRIAVEIFKLKGNEDVTPWELLVHSNKPDIVSENDLLQIGQKLRIPTQSGVIHTVFSTQTLSEIALQYDVTTADITAIAVNGISDANALRIGQEILIPNPKRFAKPAPPPAPAAAPSSGSGGSTTVRGGTQSRSGFIWPTTGPISSYFGPSHPLGIDIDLYAAPNAPVAAAAGGVVTFAGGNACCSYGYYVVVDHGNGFQTLYAHLSRISVSVGQKVNQGQLLGYAGRTGYATGNHLHFEVHLNGVTVNPLSYLP